MKLGEYLKENHLKQQFIIDRIGTTQAHVSHWVNGRAVPRIATIRKIEKLTNGKVSLKDWFTE